MGTKIHQAIGQTNQVRLSQDHGLRLLLQPVGRLRGFMDSIWETLFICYFRLWLSQDDTVRPRMYPAYLGGTFAFRSELDSYLALADVGKFPDLLNMPVGSRLYLENVFRADEAAFLQLRGWR